MTNRRSDQHPACHRCGTENAIRAGVNLVALVLILLILALAFRISDRIDKIGSATTTVTETSQ